MISAVPRRPLTETEIAEARLVFADGFDYTRAQVFEGATWTDFVDNVGAVIQRRKRDSNIHNAITLGNTSYFPIPIRTSPEVLATGDLTHMTWLIHELTHQWQYQHLGWRYLTKALGVQLREGRRSYDYAREFGSREKALTEAKNLGRMFASFNLEQQGDITRDYYFFLKQKLDFSPWEPFIDEVRKARRVNARKA
jgi:hypothetical protein